MEITRTWYLELDGIPLATPAWEIPDLSGFLDSPTLRGRDVLIPGAPGVVPLQRRVTSSVITFPLDVFGVADEDGVAADDKFEQLNANMEYLRTALPVGELITAVFYRGDLDPWEGDVHFLGFRGSRTVGIELLRTTFDLSVPAGQFEVSGS